MDQKRLVEQLQRSQLRQGKNNEGRLLQPPYSFSYLLEKRELNTYNAPAGTADLFVTGDFHKSIYTEQEEYLLNIDTDRSKVYFDKLIDKYEGVLGMNNDSRSIIAKAYYESITDRINKILKG